MYMQAIDFAGSRGEERLRAMAALHLAREEMIEATEQFESARRMALDFARPLKSPEVAAMKLRLEEASPIQVIRPWRAS
jgi:hypothetical protein